MKKLVASLLFLGLAVHPASAQQDTTIAHFADGPNQNFDIVIAHDPSGFVAARCSFYARGYENRAETTFLKVDDVRQIEADVEKAQTMDLSDVKPNTEVTVGTAQIYVKVSHPGDPKSRMVSLCRGINSYGFLGPDIIQLEKDLKDAEMALARQPAPAAGHAVAGNLASCFRLALPSDFHPVTDPATPRLPQRQSLRWQNAQNDSVTVAYEPYAPGQSPDMAFHTQSAHLDPGMNPGVTQWTTSMRVGAATYQVCRMTQAKGKWNSGMRAFWCYYEWVYSPLGTWTLTVGGDRDGAPDYGRVLDSFTVLAPAPR